MRIAINTGTRQVVTWANEPVTALDFTRGDIFPVEIRFIEGAGFIPLPAGATGRILLKPPGAFAGAPVAAALSWVATGSARTATYTFTLSLDTAPVAALFAEEPASCPLALEIEWQHSGTRQTTIPVPVTLANEYIRQTEGTPPAVPDLKATQAEAEAGTSNEKWMSPLRTKQAISAQTAPLSERLDYLTENLDPAAIDSVAEAAASIGTLQSDLAGKVTAYKLGGETPVPDLSPAALELRETGVYQSVALKLDTDNYNALDPNSPNPWQVALPDKLRAAISAASLDGSGKVPSTQLPTLATSDIASERVSFEITGSHPAVEGFYDIWDIELTSGRFRWANSNAAAEGATWTALRWNADRWELGSYTAFTTWTPLYFNTSASDIPPSAGWQPLASHPAGTIFVSGAGTPAANGTYTPSGTRNGKTQYSNGTVSLYWESDYGGRWRFDSFYVIGGGNNNSPGVTTDTPPLTGWWIAAGGSPAPTVTPATALPTLQWFSQPASVEIAALYARASRLQKQFDDQGSINTAALAGKQPAGSYASASSLATLESSLGTLSQQNADAASITGGTAYFDTLEAATAHAATEGTLTISAAGDILGSGANKLLGFVAGGATY